MGFNTSYSVGGVIDEVKKLPKGVAPEKLNPFVKGFRLSVPAVIGIYEAAYTLPRDMNLLGIAVVMSGYADNDYWELTVTTSSGERKVCETVYTKELPEEITFIPNVGIELKTNDTVKFSFANDSGTSKTIWFNLKFVE